MTVQQILILLLVLSLNEPAMSTDLTTTPFSVGSQYEYSYSTEVSRYISTFIFVILKVTVWGIKMY